MAEPHLGADGKILGGIYHGMTPEDAADLDHELAKAGDGDY